MEHQQASGQRAADIELPPSMANLTAESNELTPVGRATVLLLAYARRRYARLCQLTQQPHKHGANRLAEKAELEIALKPFGVDPREGDVDATGSEGCGR